MRIGRNPKESVKVEEPKDVVVKKDEKPQTTETTGGGTDGGINTDIGVGKGVQQMNGEDGQDPETNPDTQGEGGDGSEDCGDAHDTPNDNEASTGEGQDEGEKAPDAEPAKGKRGRPAKK